MRDERAAWAMYLLGRFLSGECRYELAEALLLAALDQMPELVAARVELGVVYCGLERYEEMAEEFREAIRLDTRAVRAVVRKEPKELAELWRMLYPAREPTPTGRSYEPPIPSDVRASAALAEEGVAALAAGRDRPAVDLIERALRLDPTRADVIAMLALAYLVLWEQEKKVPRGNKESVLWEEQPELANFLFSG